ncbi:hypothetical protein BU204_16225 [Actinophytocola xanthii]|uniref:Metalloprotease n=1 Tax=Actinophytocola xanthii TaxID=1912961 RepID=A0A1Q8CQ95_9PSEU|nr:hypothetical protein BU204_16225 [Actinophytocola xanthii]
MLAGALLAVLVVAGTVGALVVADRGSSDADAGHGEPTRGTRDRAVTPTAAVPSATTPRPVYSLADNPLFAAGLGAPPVTCRLSRWATTPRAAAAFLTSALPCLDAAWGPVLRRAGLPFSPPALAFPAGTAWTSPCGAVAAGRGEVAAFYCGRNKTVYLPFGGLQTESYGARPGVYLAVLAHEYGHHVQDLSGVRYAYATERHEAGPDTGPGLELSRRLELQAQCFSGMFFAAARGRGSVDASILADARASQDRGDHHAGRPRVHGTDAHNSAWWELGVRHNRTARCNTWRSAPGAVA